MPELRQDELTGRWVIIAPQRAERPHAFDEDARVELEEPGGESCPFCEGHEAMTPGEVLAYRREGSRADGPGWRVRVIPNKFPAVLLDENSGHLGAESVSGMSAYTLAGQGQHEVIIECPQHLAMIGDLDVAAFEDIVRAYRDRLRSVRASGRWRSALIFKNTGSAAGASLEHAHSQLLALPLVPPVLATELAAAESWHARHGQCYFCALLERTGRDGVRLVQEMPEFVAVCPFASQWPYETWLLPRRHRSHFEELSDEELAQLAQSLRQTLRKLESVLERRAYNYWIHSAPFDTPANDHYHWHIEIIPRLTKTAGFEWGAGMGINPVLPEAAAAALRSAKIY